MAQAQSLRKVWRRVLGRRRRWLIVAGTVSALITLSSGYAFGYLMYLQGSLSNPEGLGPLPQTLTGVQNILVLGSDSRAKLTPEEQKAKGDETKVPGRRSDTIILMHVDPRTHKTVVIHFPRDLMVPIAGTGTENRINTAFETGPRRLIDTIEDFSGLQINHYVEVDFGGFQNIVDSMGGVRICIDRPLVDELAELNLPNVGCYVLGGKMALAFVRARSVDTDIIPDYSRIARQQQFLRAVLNRVFAPTSIFKLPTLASAVIGNITVDEDLKVVDINDIARRLRELGTPKVDFRVVPSTPVAGQGYVNPIKDLADELFARVRDGRPLGKFGLEIGQYTDLYANIDVRVMNAGGDVGLVETRFSDSGFALLPRTSAPDGVTRSTILYAHGRETAAAAVAQFLARIFKSGDIPVEEAPKGSLNGAAVGVVVAPDFPEPIRRPSP
jgi:LCP family protein required for cell wall assembly